jgi:hypothetical protein
MIGVLSFDLSPFQGTMVACAVVEAGLNFAQLRYVPKTPATRRLQAASVGIAFIVIIAAALYKLGVVS